MTRGGRGWAYASEREAARGRSGIDIRRELLLSFTPPEDPASVAGYERAVATLGVATLEGMVFTVAALARVLDSDEEELSDWLDDDLVLTPTTRTRRSTASASSRSPGSARSIATRSGTACCGACCVPPPRAAAWRAATPRRSRPSMART